MHVVPRTFSLDPQTLAENREHVRAGDRALAAAAATLRHEAEAVRAAGPFSVVDKTVPAPSGDPHDYVSFGPYWWPDPAAPDGLPYIRRDGERNPEFEDPARSDSPRLHALTEAVSALAEAHYFLGDVAPYGERAATLLRTWFLDAVTRMSPHLEYGQAIPGRVTGRGIGIIDTSRLVYMVDDLGMLAGAPGWRAEDEAGIAEWFAAYLDWLLTSGHGRDERAAANNHGTWYDAQVASFALLVGREDVARATIAGARTLRIDTQVEPDGRQPHELARTKALSYSVFNLKALCCLAAMGKRVGVDLWGYRSPTGGSIQGAIDWLLPYVAESAEWPYPQIEPFERLDLLPLLYRARAAYGDARYMEGIAMLDAERVAAARATLLCPTGEPRQRRQS